MGLIADFSNQTCRPLADWLANSYLWADYLYRNWQANGGDQAALDFMEPQIRAGANDMTRAYYVHAIRAFDIWVGMDGANSVPDNDTPIDDGAPEDGRQVVVNGGTVGGSPGGMHRINENAIDFVRFMINNDFTAAAPVGTERQTLQDVVRVSDADPRTMALSEAQRFIDICKLMKDWYEAPYDDLNEVFLNHELNEILAYAVNPKDVSQQVG